MKVTELRSRVVESKKVDEQPTDTATTKLYHISDDVLYVIISYLQLKEILQLDLTNKLFNTTLRNQGFWHRLGNRLVLQYNNVYSIQHHIVRKDIIQYEGMIDLALQFISRMKLDRASDRKKDIVPNRYSKSEKTVTHPLPIFGSDKIMSSAECFNSDFRTYALKSLGIISTITSSYKDYSIEYMVNEGLLTVLISLLQNEYSILKELSCCCIANLLVWESRRRRVNVGRTTSEEKNALSFQLNTTGATKLIVSLLTSPSAKVNLHGLSNNRIVDGKISTMTSSSVQGVTTKEASRCLISLYQRNSPIPKSHIHCLNEIFLDKTVEFQFRYFFKSGSLKDRFSAYLHFGRNRLIRGRGVDSIGVFILHGSQEIDISSSFYHIKKSYIRLEDYDITIDDYLRNPNEELPNNGTAIVNHIIHNAYYSAGRDVDPQEREQIALSPPIVNDEYDADDDYDDQWEQSGVFGLAFYGVYEANQNEFFQLQKGGVFSATPVYVFS